MKAIKTYISIVICLLSYHTVTYAQETRAIQKNLTMEAENKSYILELLKKDKLLYPIIKNRSFENVDFGNCIHDFPTPNGCNIYNYQMGEEFFERVVIGFVDSLGIDLCLTTNEPKYFDNPLFYFGREGTLRTKPQLGKKKVQLGIYYTFDPPVRITVFFSPDAEYFISLWFLSDEILKKTIKPQF